MALQPKPAPMPRALDVHGLFSTEPDLHGGFTDVSAFVRDSDPDADVTVIWRDWQGSSPPRADDLDGPDLDIQNEGCSVPFYHLRDVIQTHRATAWIWDDDGERWQVIRSDDIRPGMVIMLHREVGCYHHDFGWTGEKNDKLPNVPRVGRGRSVKDDKRTEYGYWTTLPVHLNDAKDSAIRLCKDIGLRDDDEKLRPFYTAVIEAAALHDLGKALPQWQRALPASNVLVGGPWAKCPYVLAVDATSDDAAIFSTVVKLRSDALAIGEKQHRRGREALVRIRWAIGDKLPRDKLEELRAINGVKWASHESFRPGLRHEAASALAIWKRYCDGNATYPALTVYLAAAHHGKVRTVLRATSDKGDDVFGITRETEALTVDEEQWPIEFSVAKDGAEGEWQDGKFILTGYGWTGLVADLLGPWRSDDLCEVGAVPKDDENDNKEPRRLGPFVLAYLEALVRAADWRASDNPSKCLKPNEVRNES